MTNEESLDIRAVRFGIFELDLRARELRKSGLSLKLEATPLQVLELLLEKAGELVTRKELRERLWPDSFVAFDRCINTAMSKLRRVLGDAIDNPRFIETRCRLGYRFIAPVSAAHAATPTALAPTDEAPADQPVMIGFSVHRPSSIAPLAAITNPRLDGGALRFQVRHPDGNLAEFSVRLTTTTDGGLNMRLDLCSARSEGGQPLSGRSEVESDYPYHASTSRSSMRGVRP